MRHIKFLLIAAFIPLSGFMPKTISENGNENVEEDAKKLENPFTTEYLKSRLRKTTPRLVLTPGIEKELRSKLKSDPVTKNYFQAMILNANGILEKPLLERKVEGRRLLGVSREMLYRMNVLAMVYRINHDKKLLSRIDDELKAVCRFSDWNPSHYLDVAEMALAVALAVDWVGKDLPNTTYDLAITSLIEKGIKPSYDNKVNGWVNNNNNWNQVCNGGMIAASIGVAEKDPELAAKTIHRALDGMPNALAEYGPDGVYPEGATYWGYGTSFSVITSSMLESAFGKDFGIAEYPAFKKSAEFRYLSEAPSHWYFNFADCGDKADSEGDITLAWFAKQTGNPLYLEKDKFMIDPAAMGKLSRLCGAGLVWLSQFKGGNVQPLPAAWKGKGSNPVVIFRSDANNSYYVGAKGGRGSSNHGNMDAGSFVFELNGVRWSVDPGNQDYNALEKTGFDLWGRCQNCQRWTLLTKNNFGHSTITINDQHHLVDGFADLVDFTSGNTPQATFDLTPIFGNNIKTFKRKFAKENDQSLLIEDQFECNDSTKMITWQMMTTASVEIIDGGAILRQSGKVLKVENLSLPDVMFSVISLDPPPLELDRRIEGLKRIELRVPAYLLKDRKGEIRVLLAAGS